MHSAKAMNFPKAVILLVFLLLAVSTACQAETQTPGPKTASAGSNESRNEFDRIWEAWRLIKNSYANQDTLDSPQVVGGVVERLLALTDSPPYPFLTEVGKLRRQPPSYVPAQLGDVWRALALHRQKWPQFKTTELAEAAIQGLIDGLHDPYASYISADEYTQARQSLVGNYQGIGARVLMQQDQLVLSPTSRQPADRAGVQDGDVLVAVNGKPVTGRSPAEVIEQVKGPPGSAGSRVKLMIERSGEPEPLELEVVRGNVDVTTVQFQLVPGGIAYMAVGTFNENTGEQVVKALEDLSRVDMLALILDLRFSAGGPMEVAQQIASQFLPASQLFVYEVDLAGKRRDWPVQEEGVVGEDLPVVVLIDADTAGESEAIVAAFQEAKRAVVMGMPSAAKGTSNSFVELSDGSAMYLPTSRWYTPSGQGAPKTGISPDKRVASQPEETGFGEKQLNEAYSYLNSKLPPFR